MTRDAMKIENLPIHNRYCT